MTTKHHDIESLRFAAAPDLIRVKATQDGTISGYASTFGGEPDRHRDIVVSGAFQASLAEHKAAGTRPAMLWSHDQHEPIGRWVTVAEDHRGLAVKGALNLRTQRGKDAYEHVLNGDLNGLSIGFQVRAGGQEYREDGVTILKSLVLHEISIVTLPANAAARITSVKSADRVRSKAEFFDYLRADGFPKSLATRLAAGWPARDDDEQQQAIELIAAIDRAISQLRSNTR